MPHVLTLVEQFWHKVPGGTARATERTLAALLDRDEFTVTGLIAYHRRDDPRLATLTGGPAVRRSVNGIDFSAEVSSPLAIHRHRMPRPMLYESWLRFGRPSIDRVAGPDSLFWASSSIVAATTRPVVSTVHDLDFLDAPHLLTPRGRSFFPRMWDHARSTSRLFVCPSQAVAEQCRRNGVHGADVRVVPWGVDPPLCADDEADDVLDEMLAVRQAGTMSLPRDYVLLVAPDQPRKNPSLCADVLAATDCSAVIVGSEPGPDRPDHFAALGSAVLRLGSVSDRELSALYRRARLLLFPSVSEGFGLPVLEAMAHGLPVVTSISTATEEVAGGAAVLIDPGDVGGATQAVANLLSDEDRCAHLAIQGLARAAQMTWETTAKGYAEIFREVL